MINQRERNIVEFFFVVEITRASNIKKMSNIFFYYKHLNFFLRASTAEQELLFIHDSSRLVAVVKLNLT